MFLRSRDTSTCAEVTLLSHEIPDSKLCLYSQALASVCYTVKQCLITGSAGMMLLWRI